jgi:signal transduction histidine kinase
MGTPRRDALPWLDLLQTFAAIGSDLDLDDVLDRIVHTAADLVDAKYAALGVLDPSGGQSLSQFITVGIDDQEQQRIGHLPHGEGVLGVLIKEPRAVRLADIGDHPASYGFPENHPAMKTFLGVPISVRGEAFGNLYLTEKRGGGEFTEADEQVVVALATAAGLAVQNARLFEQSQRRRQELQAASDVTTLLLAGASTTKVFVELVAQARELAGADLALLALPVGDGRLRVEAADGRGAQALRGGLIPARSMTADVMRAGVAATVEDIRTDPRVWPGLLDAAGIGPALYVPLGTPDDAMGTLIVAQAADKPAFGDDIALMVEVFAAQAALALRLGAAAADREQLAILADRDRIARDLHDLVIQRLFATGMALEGALRSIEPEPAAERVRRAVDDLDSTIKEIRTTIFALQSPAPASGEGLRSAVLQAVHAVGATLGFEPHVEFVGAVDTLVPAAVGEQLLAVLREGLSNAARHASAARVDVAIRAAADSVELVVRDDGCGLAPDGRRSGLANLARRARDLSGTFTAEPHPDGGTIVTWRVPLSG